MHISRRILAATSTIAFGIAPLAASAGVPAYPGATMEPHANSKAVDYCGHQVSVVASFTTNDAPEKAAAWYKGRIPGAIPLRSTSDPNQTSIVVYDDGGSEAVVISKMHVSAALRASAAELGMDKTDIGVETFEPPLGRAYIDLARQTASSPAQAHAARAKLAAMCPNG